MLSSPQWWKKDWREGTGWGSFSATHRENRGAMLVQHLRFVRATALGLFPCGSVKAACLRLERKQLWLSGAWGNAHDLTAVFPCCRKWSYPQSAEPLIREQHKHLCSVANVPEVKWSGPAPTTPLGFLISEFLVCTGSALENLSPKKKKKRTQLVVQVNEPSLNPTDLLLTVNDPFYLIMNLNKWQTTSAVAIWYCDSSIEMDTVHRCSFMYITSHRKQRRQHVICIRRVQTGREGLGEVDPFHVQLMWNKKQMWTTQFRNRSSHDGHAHKNIHESIEPYHLPTGLSKMQTRNKYTQ